MDGKDEKSYRYLYNAFVTDILVGLKNISDNESFYTILKLMLNISMLLVFFLFTSWMEKMKIQNFIGKNLKTLV